MKGKSRNKKGGQSRRKPLPERGSKNQRRDAEIADTASREYADSRDRRDCYKSSSNDWQWYAQNAQLVKDYASYPFGRALGTRLSIADAQSLLNASGGVNINNQAMPGLMVYYYQPGVGQPTDANAPINIASRNIYSYVRHANSGHTNYDAPDLMLYMLAMDSVYMYHSFLKRIVGLLYDYSTLNRYYPESLIRAMGVDFDDISHHITDLRGFVNQYAVKMGSMCVPNSMSYMARHVWMTEGIYTDGTASKSQTYMYVPCSFYQFELDSESKGQLSMSHFSYPHLGYITMSQNLKKYADLVQFGNSLLDPILSSEDMAIMSGDILKAFGDSGVVKVSGISEGYMILPTYNQEVLSQMENCTVIGQGPSLVTQNADINGGFLQVPNSAFKIAFNVPTGFNAGDGETLSPGVANTITAAINGRKVLNFHHSDVTPEEVMVATRLTNIVDIASSTVNFFGSNGVGQLSMNVSTAASEVVTAAIAFQYTWNSNVMTLTGVNVGSLFTIPVTTSANAYGPTQVYINTLGVLSTFDWHHQVTPVTMKWVSTSDNYTYGGTAFCGMPMQDVDNYTIIDRNNLYNMTQTALLSEFSVPQMGAFSTKLV